MARALISVTDKTGIADFGRRLSDAGWEILSTGGTAKALREAAVPVTELSDFTGSPEMLGGRVKTLHPKVFGGILARRRDPDHVAQMAKHHLRSIDLVVVNLYDFEGTLRRSPSFEDAVENIDIGGPSLLRAAAKNHQDVVVVVDPNDYDALLEGLTGRGVDDVTRRRLAAKVFEHTARYDALVAAYLNPEPDPFPDRWLMPLDRIQSLRYGENPHQAAALYRPSGVLETGWAAAEIHQGKALSYNNLLDLEAGFGLALDLMAVGEPDRACAVYIKHNNPCGAATALGLADALAIARSCDPVSAFGAVIACTKELDVDAAQVLTEAFAEAVVAPSYAPEALAVLAKKKNLRVLTMPPEAWRLPPTPPVHLRPVLGGVLAQEQDTGPGFAREVEEAALVTRVAPDDEQRVALRFAWTVAKHVRSNAIVFGRSDRVLAVGAGQMSRVDSVKICRLKAGDALDGSVVASDAFFPFRDGVDVLADAGARAIIQPGGSVRDEEVVAAADEHGLAMLFTGVRHFRH
ncbi:MAG: bifunctional phosphoribosylaminoimidazolecarboxamide formyltransferase/IMP cyclohydrolase [Myxococcota bacterium]